MAFDQGRDVAVLRSGQQIAFPMTRDRTILDRCRSLTDRHDILDLPPSIAIGGRRPGSPDRTLRSKMAKQFLLKHAAGLNKEAAIDRLVRHAISLIFPMGSLEPACYLLGRPIQSELSRHCRS